MRDVRIHTTHLGAIHSWRRVHSARHSSNRVWRVEGSEESAIAILRSASGVAVFYQATWSRRKAYPFSLMCTATAGWCGANTRRCSACS